MNDASPPSPMLQATPGVTPTTKLTTSPPSPHPQAAGNLTFTYTPNTFFIHTETSVPRGITNTSVHDAVGQPTKRTDSRSVASTFTYDDALSRPTLFQFDAGTPEDATWTYDRDTLHTASSPIGGTFTYTYDAQDRLTF